jgi:hypothetical protein
MRERFLLGLVIGCLMGALVAPLVAQSWNRLMLTRKATTPTVTSITRSGTTATVTATAHALLTGDTVTIAGADQAEYNGSFAITRTGADTFTYTVPGTPATPATGVITCSYGGGTPIPLAAGSGGAASIVF